MVVFLFPLALSLAGCSGGEKKDDTPESKLEEDFPTAEAQPTDAVPEQTAQSPENPQIPAEVPPQEPAPALSGAPTGETQEYRVHRGDTLMKIAYDVYGDVYQWKRIYQANSAAISDPMKLSSGTVLRLERPATPFSPEKNGSAFLIRKGDTLGTISDDVYGTKKKWKRIWENNRSLIRDPNKIFAGFYVYYTMTPEDEQEKAGFKGDVRQPAGDNPSGAPAEAAPQAGQPAPTAGT